MSTFYEHYRFSGSYREVGRQHGEALREQIRQHLELIYELSDKESHLPRERALSIAKYYESYILEYTPGFMEELAGLGEGAGITADEALLLQVRQEVVNLARHGSADRECTSYAVGTGYTSNGKVYSGQNIDLAGDFERISNVVTFAVDGRPKILMVSPAGQISCNGINERGMSINCNYLPCDGWKKGYPRYLISRMLIEKDSFGEACAALEGIKERAASRNFLLADRNGNIADFETTSTAVGRIDATGKFVHSNHFLHPNMLLYETSEDYEMVDSLGRLNRLNDLFEQNKGKINDLTIQGFLRNHDDEPYCVCMHPFEKNAYHTFASLIQNLTDSVMEVCKGNPCQGEYVMYEC